MLRAANEASAERAAGRFRSADFTRPLLTHLGRELRAHDFRRQGSTFRREPEPGLLLALQVQSGLHYPDGPSLTYGQFTVNLSVDLEELYLLCDRPQASTKPFGRGMGMVVAIRLGHLVHQRDVWWPMAGEPTDAGDRIFGLLLEHGLPFLGRFSSRAFLETELRHSPSITFARPAPIALAALLWGRGRTDEAVNTLRGYLAAGVLPPPHRAVVEKLLDRIVHP